ncbi:hypothetical protein [Chitinophaga sp. MM2321]|uniref:hypothetical protein n=1 Tax=Chitinophaga sp. MM2321 TaxID=3137178 RepID=UPI0032D5A872
MDQHYQLSFFERLIRVELKQHAITLGPPDKNLFSSTTAQAIREKDKMLQCFGRDVYGMGNDKQVEWHIQMHQYQLVVLMDQITGLLSPAEIATINELTADLTWNNFYKIIYANLAELLSFLEREFSRYLNLSYKIPITHWLSARNGFVNEMKIISDGFTAAQIDEQLSSIVLQSFLDFPSAENNDSLITYRQLFYLRRLQKELSALLINNNGGPDLAEKLKDLLLYLNFNNVHYLRYCTDSITMEITELPTIREKLDHLIFLQKKINQTNIKPGFIFNKLHPTLQNQLKAWLNEEISYLHRKTHLSAPGHSPDELSRWKDFKVITVLSVAQLGYIIKLLLGNGVFLNRNKTELLDFFSQFFTTVKQDNVSSGSLRTNFYKEDANVSKAVRGIFMDLVNYSLKGVNVAVYFVLDFFLRQF